MGRRDLADVVLPPFEMALRLGGARSVMHSYAEIDGVPVGRRRAPADRPAARAVGLRRHGGRRLLRDPFLQTLHGVAPTGRGGRARAARRASTSSCPPCDASASRWSPRSAPGAVDEALVDRALRRVLRAEGRARPARRDVAARARRRRRAPPRRRRPARTSRCGWPGKSVVLLSQRRRSCRSPPDRGSPWSARSPTTRWRMLGCYSFPAPRGRRTTPSTGSGSTCPTLRDALGARAARHSAYEPGCAVTGPTTRRRLRGGRGRWPRDGDVCVRRRR